MKHIYVRAKGILFVGFLMVLMMMGGKSFAQVNYVSWDFTPTIVGSYAGSQTNMDGARTTALSSPTITGITLGTVTSAAATTLHRSTGWPIAASPSATSYLEFSVTLTGGQTFPNSSMTLDLKTETSSATSAPSKLQPTYGYGASPSFSNAGAALTISTTPTQLATITIPAPGNTTTTKITIRILCYSSTTNTGNVRLYTVALKGASIAAGTITPTPSTLTGLTYVSGSGPSASSSFALAASGLTAGGGTLTISGSTDYEVSSDNSTFGSSATLAYTGTGALASNTAWVRLKSGLAVANYNSETISISGGTGSASVTVSGNVTSASAPANDNCSGAVSLTVGAAAVTGSDAGASQSLAGISCAGGDNADDDVWYSFTTSTAGSYTITVAGSASYDAVIDLRSGACNGSNIGCADATLAGGTETVVAPGLAANTTYYVRVYDFYAGTPATTTFTIQVVQTPATIYTWTGTNTPWLTTTDWSPAGYPQTSDHIAYYNTNGSVTSGINMNTLGGVLNIGAIDFGAGATTNRTINNSSGTVTGVLTLSGQIINSIPYTIIHNLSSGTHTITNGSNTMNVALGNANDNIINIEGAGGITIASIITGGTSNPLTKAGSGAGVLTLSGSNTYTGITSIKAGTLNAATIANGGTASPIGASGTAAANLVLGGGTLQYSTAATISTNRNFTLTAATTSTIDLVNSTSNLTISGGGAATTGALTKIGAGTLAFTGTNSYTGLTTVTAGTLQLNKTGGTTIPVTNNVTVNGGTLKVSTAQTLNDVNLSTGSITVDAGVTLTINGTLTISGAGTVTGTIAYGPTGSLVYSNGAARTAGAEWPATNYPYNVTLNNASTNITLAANSFAGNDLTINNTAILTGTGFTLTVSGSWNVASSGGYAHGGNASSLVVLNGSGSKTFNHTGGAAFRNLTFSGSGTYTVNNDINIVLNNVTVSSGTVDMGTNSLNGTGNIVMNGGTLKLAKTGVNLPELTGTSPNITGGTLELSGAGAQTLKGSRDYANLTFSGTGTKGVTSAIGPTNTITGTVTVADAVTLDVSNVTTFGGAATSLTLVLTGKIVLGGAAIEPTITGGYNFGVGSTVEFAGSSAVEIRLALPYYNILASGSNVSTNTSTASIVLQSGGTFSVTGTVKMKNANGLSGATNTFVSNTNSPTVSLSTGSTIDYSDVADQTITNQVPYGNLLISAVSGIKSPAASSLVRIKGNFSKTGAATFAPNSGTMQFEGASAQAISSSSSALDFYNLTNANTSGGLNINNDINVNKKLSFTGSALLNLASGNITMKSTATNTADIDVVTGSVTYGTGQFIIEKYIKTLRKWQFLSPDATSGSNTFQTDWMEGQSPATMTATGNGMWITGVSGTPNFDAMTVAPTIKWWDGSAYQPIAAVTDPIHTYPAYMTYVRGDRGSTGAITGANAFTVLRTKGQIHVGNYPGTPTHIPTLAGYFALGNPYASVIDLRSISTNAPLNTPISILVWDPQLAGYGLGAFQTLTGSQQGGFTISPGGGSYGLALNAPMNFIESGQAFFVQSAGVDMDIQFNEAAKNTYQHTVSFTAGQAQSIGGQLFAKNNGVNDLADGFLVKFDQAYSNNADNSDARKMLNTNENISVKKQNALLAVELRKPVDETDTIRINMANMRQVNYHWDIIAENMDAPGRIAYLSDKFLGRLTSLDLATATGYDFSVTADPASSAADRFMIIFKQSAILPVTMNSISATRLNDQSVLVNWKAENELNIQHYEIERSATGNNFTQLGTQLPTNNAGGASSYGYTDAKAGRGVNYYRVKAISNNGLVQYSPTVKADGKNDAAAVSVYPNPVTDHILHIEMNKQPAGKYAWQMLNAEGKIILTGSFDIQGGGSVNEVDLPLGNNAAAGTYMLQLSGPDGYRSVQKVSVR